MDRSGPSYEYDFDPEAENNTAAAIYRLARAGGPRILDLGSGPAIVSSRLRSADAKDVTCVDADGDRLEAARRRGIERVICANLESGAWADAVVGETFDVIILADVLEHLARPELVLRLIGERRLLSDSGFLVISIPNGTHEAVAAAILTGDWRYRETGLLDSTHLRFFSKESFTDLLESEGFVATQLHRTRMKLEETELAPLATRLSPEARRQIADISEGTTYQFVMRAEPAEAASEIARLRENVGKVTAERDAYKTEKDRLVAAVDSLKVRVARLAQQNDKLERRISMIQGSRTWRIGRVVTRAARVLARPERTLLPRRRKDGAPAVERDHAPGGRPNAPNPGI